MRLLSSFVLLLGLTRVAFATSVVARSDRELLARSDVVAVGQIMRTHTVIDAHKRIITQAELQVTRSVRGAQRGEFLIVVVPGGALKNGAVARTVGAPTLAVGDVVLGFFERAQGAYVPKGLSFGLLRVTSDAQGRQLVHREARGLTLYQANGRLAPEGMFELRAVPLDDYLATLDTSVRELERVGSEVKR